MEPATHAPSGALVGESPFLSVIQPDVQRRLLLAALAHPSVALLRFPDGSPALAGRTLGTGRCALLTTSVDLGWGDLALSGEFVALIAQTVQWLLGARRPTEAPRAGETITLPAPSTHDDVIVATPAGASVRVPLTGTFTDTRAAGPYSVQVDGEPSERQSFIVESEAVESDLRGAPSHHARADNASGAASGARRRSWVPMLLLLATLMLVAEGLLRVRFPVTR
jgi:hypothetical protein